MLGYTKSIIYLHIKAPILFFVGFFKNYFVLFLICFIFMCNFTMQPTVWFPGVRLHILAPQNFFFFLTKAF